MNTISSLSGLITTADVEGDLDSQIFDTLTFDSGGKPHRAISKASTWCFAKLISADAIDRVFNNDESELLKDVLLKRTVYELYTMSEVEGSADDKRKDAYVLLNALLKLSGTDSEHDQQPTNKPSLISVSSPTNATRIVNPFNF